MAVEHKEYFATEYGQGRDYEPFDIGELVIGCGRFLAEIGGEEAAGDAITAFLRKLGEHPSDWRNFDKSMTMDWPIGRHFMLLNAYAHRGIVASHTETAAEHEALLKETLDAVDHFMSIAPLALWGMKDTDMENTWSLAKARWDLDNGRPVQPAALAMFGGISEGRMRNLMAGAHRVFTPIDGKIPAVEALDWLKTRKTFHPSTWRDQGRYWDDSYLPEEQIEEHVYFVPVAQDGSMFVPGIIRNGTYTVGVKKAEKHFESYEEALAYLHTLTVASWRRPNANGNWGIVRAVSWARLTNLELASHSEQGQTQNELQTAGESK